MLGTYSDEFGKLDFERSQHGSGMSNRSQAKRFVSALSSVAERTYNNLFDVQQLRHIARELQIRVSSASAPPATPNCTPATVTPRQRESSQGTSAAPLCNGTNHQFTAARLSRAPQVSLGASLTSQLFAAAAPCTAEG